MTSMMNQRPRQRVSDQTVQLILAEYKKGVSVPELLHRFQITDRSFYRWKKKYGVANVDRSKVARAS